MVRPSYVTFCQNFWNLSHETVPLSTETAGKTILNCDRAITPAIRVGICKRLRSPGMDSKESIPPAYIAWRVEPVFVDLLWSLGIDSQPGGIDSSELIPELHKRLQIRALELHIGCGTGPPGWESVPGLPKKFTNLGSGVTFFCGAVYLLCKKTPTEQLLPLKGQSHELRSRTSPIITLLSIYSEIESLLQIKNGNIVTYTYIYIYYFFEQRKIFANRLAMSCSVLNTI